MGDLAVRIEGLGKQYRIGAQQKSRSNLRDVLGEALAAPFQRAGRLLSGEAYGASNATETIWALKDVSFEVNRGEVVGIIGRNGAGKSTLLKILSSITEPTEGRVEMYGRVGALLEVGTGFHAELTGRENIYLNAAILGMVRSEIDRKFDEIVAFAEVEKFIDTPVKRYSSGMGLRLGFAVAAHLEPEILIVDEVLAVGDASFQKKCIGKMSNVASEGRTVLFVSHNMYAVNNLCSKGIVVESGRVAFDGAIDGAIGLYLKQDIIHGLAADLTHSKRTTTNKARFEAITITSSDGEASFPKTGDDVQIQVRVRCYERIRDAVVAVVIRDNKDCCIIHANTSILGQTVNMNAGEVRSWTFELHNVLLHPAVYKIEAYLGIEHVGPIDFIPDAMTFEVQFNKSLPSSNVDYPGIYRCDFAISSKG